MTSEQFKKIKAHAILASDMLKPPEERSFKNRMVFEKVLRDFISVVAELDEWRKAEALTQVINAGGDH